VTAEEAPDVEALKNFFTFFVLLNSFIPLSLMVTLELIRFFQVAHPPPSAHARRRR
jgi:magnesium-transporting ATPase (P-type)